MASVDERGEDGENQQTDLWILHQSEGQQRLQERRGQRRQQVTAFIALRYLEDEDDTSGSVQSQRSVLEAEDTFDLFS